MIVSITSKRQVTFPKQVMEKLHLHEGDMLTLSETDEGILIRPNRFDINNFAPLRDKIAKDMPAPDIDSIHHASLDKNLRS